MEMEGKHSQQRKCGCLGKFPRKEEVSALPVLPFLYKREVNAFLQSPSETLLG